ncbi:hypothetical protein HP439_09195 [Sphingobacterium shayense]|uniref:hypothetical protein n=1 Tax=Sphingobacterium shayense TaxID=626343 RepID=UPI00155604FA|nr:hypothetical protein [Sphingobacterium shayense]NQD70892.1 hypothetical protein [Sphingobacterium shayense]
MKFCLKSIMVILSIIFVGHELNAQTMGEIDIQRISIKDTFLVNEISKVIIEQETRSAGKPDNLWFKNGYGYIRLTFNTFSHGDTLHSFHISPDQSPIGRADDESFPNYYAFINGRPILIYNKHSIMQPLELIFSDKSKKRFLKRLNHVLPKGTKQIGKDDKGNVVLRIENFRPQYLTFGLSKSIYQLKDKSYIVTRDSVF